MRQTPEQFHDAAMIAAMQAIVGKVPLGEKYNTPQSIQDHEYVVQAVCNGASDYATAILSHRLPDPAPAQPVHPEQRERWFNWNPPRSGRDTQATLRFDSGGVDGYWHYNGERGQDCARDLGGVLELVELGRMIELSPATGLPLEQDKAKPDARAVVEECERSITDLLAIIGDDLTHKRQHEHAEALMFANTALARAREFLEGAK